jgi:hypothetical protein
VVPPNQLKLEINTMVKTHGWLYQITPTSFEDEFIATAARLTTLESVIENCQGGEVFDLSDRSTLPDDVLDITGLIQNQPSSVFVYVAEDDYGDPDCFYFGFEPLSHG